VHIPFFARGPGIKPGTRLTALASNIDIAPTMIEVSIYLATYVSMHGLSTL
jgi:arylsulfatase A-like enzyme